MVWFVITVWDPNFGSKNLSLQRHKSNSSKIELLRRNREKNKNDLNLQTKILISNQLQLKKSTEHLKQQEGFHLTFSPC